MRYNEEEKDSTEEIVWDNADQDSEQKDAGPDDDYDYEVSDDYDNPFAYRLAYEECRESNRKLEERCDDLVRSNRIKNVIIGILIIIILLLLKGCPCGGISQNTQNQNTPSIEVEDDNKWDGQIHVASKAEVDNGTIAIPGYANLTVSKENSAVRLVNPEENTVYLKYALYEGDALVCETKAIKPGNMYEAELFGILGKGDHELSFVISTYDIETEEMCNGATQRVNLLVE